MHSESVTGVVLAGGMARRMGGTDKGWIEFEGRPLIRYAIDVLSAATDRVLINANRSFDAYRALGFEVISDLEGGFQGPLMGMVTGLSASETDWVVFIPCDSPRLPKDTVDRLVSAQLSAPQAKIVMANDGHRPQPVVAMLHVSLLADLKQALMEGERKIDRWFARHFMVEADFSDAVGAFANINRRDDLESLAKMPKILGFAAWSGTGKTTLLKKLLPELKNRGLRVAVLKHAHHNFEVDKPGKDSYELRKSGAAQMLVASANRWALMVDKDEAEEPSLTDMITKLDLTSLDLILVEGFKKEHFPKIELHRSSVEKPYLFPDDDNIIALVSDEPLIDETHLKAASEKALSMMSINNPAEILDFILKYTGKTL